MFRESLSLCQKIVKALLIASAVLAVHGHCLGLEVKITENLFLGSGIEKQEDEETEFLWYSIRYTF